MVEQVRFEHFLDAQPIGVAGALGLDRDPEDARLRLASFASLTARDFACWEQLGQQATTQSAYAQPWFVQPSLAQCDPAGSTLMAIVEGAGGDWLGVLPLVRASRIGCAPLPSWLAWTHANSFAGTPLVRHGAAHAFWRGLLDGLSRTSRGELALCLPAMALDDRVTRALFEICAADMRTMALDRRYARAMLTPAIAPEINPKQRRRIDSLLRKLSRDLGPCEFRLVRDTDGVAARTERFLDLEQSGWKGACGSALACSRSNRSLFTAIVEAAAARGRCELAELSVDGRAIAMSMQLTGNGRRYGFKMAYDEACAAYAPGLLLLDWLTREYSASGSVGPIDSCAAPGQLPVSRLWHERCELVDCRVALGGRLRQASMRTLLQAEIAYSGLKRLLAGAARPLET